MTTQDLKDSRDEIISRINNAGYSLKETMEYFVQIAKDYDTIDELFEELAYNFRPVKETKNARILAGLAEIEENN